MAELITRETEDDLSTAATRVWSAIECLEKSGAILDGPLTLSSSTADGVGTCS